MSRDYAAEMRAVIDAETSQGPYASPVVAAHVVEKLRATDPELLAGWLDSQAVNFIRHMINLRDCATRTHARHMSGRSVFGAAAKAHEAGETGALAGWLSVVHVCEDGERKRLSEMNAADLGFVADDYARRAAENALAEAFLRAVAKKVGRRKVGDVFDEAKLSQLWNSISGR